MLKEFGVGQLKSMAYSTVQCCQMGIQGDMIPSPQWKFMAVFTLHNLLLVPRLSRWQQALVIFSCSHWYQK